MPHNANTIYFVVEVKDRGFRDAHAAKTFDRALDLANPDIGDKITIWTVATKTAEQARLSFKKAGKRLKTWKYGGR